MTRRSRTLLRGIGWTLAFLLVTALTQVGGLAVLVAGRFARTGVGRGALAFMASYVLLLAVVAPGIAYQQGRVPLPCLGLRADGLLPATPLTCLLGRNYVAPHVRQELMELQRAMRLRNPDSRTSYLDAGFPIGGMPMLPHLSHRDGLKVDLAFSYPGGSVPSPVGYWIYEAPTSDEPMPCLGVPSLLRWDLAWLQSRLGRPWDPERTGAAIRWLAGRESVDRILLEPHLAARLGLAGPPVRFQGCRAARHDDHYHVAFRPTRSPTARPER